MAETEEFTDYEISFGIHHTGGAYFAMVDGSVAFIYENFNAVTYSIFGNRLDRQPFTLK